MYARPKSLRETLTPGTLAVLLAGSAAAAALTAYILRSGGGGESGRPGLVFEQPQESRSQDSAPAVLPSSSLDMLSKPAGWKSTEGGVSAPPQELLYEEIIYAERPDEPGAPGETAGKKGRAPFDRPTMKTGKTFRGQAAASQTGASMAAGGEAKERSAQLGEEGSGPEPRGPAKEAAAERLMAPVIQSAGPAMAAPGPQFTRQQQALYEEVSRAAQSGAMTDAQLQIAAEKAVGISMGAGPTVGEKDIAPTATPKNIFDKKGGGGAGTLGGE